VSERETQTNEMQSLLDRLYESRADQQLTDLTDGVRLVRRGRAKPN